MATIVEKFYGSSFVREYIYGARPMIILWLLLAHCAVFYMVRSGVHKRFVTFMLHISFVVILLGAYVTGRWGIQGKVHLREGEEVECFVATDGEEREQAKHSKHSPLGSL